MSFPIFQEQDYGGMLGRSIGESFGGGLQSGLLNQFQQNQQQQQQQRELSSLQQAISQAGNDPQSQLQALLMAPISNETKKLAIQSLQNQQEMNQKRFQGQEEINKQNRLFQQQRELQEQRLTQEKNIEAEKSRLKNEEIELKKSKELRREKLYERYGVGKQNNQIQENIQIKPGVGTRISEKIETEPPKEQNLDLKTIPDEEIAAVALDDPMFAKILQKGKQIALSEQHKIDDNKNRDREYAYKVNQKTRDKADAIRDSLPAQQGALVGMEDAINSNEIGPFTLDHFANMLGIEGLRSAKSGQFLAASKTFFGKAVKEVGGARPNIYLEQQMASMLPGIGRDKWANLGGLEFQKFGVDVNEKWLDLYDKFSNEDIDKYGFVKENIDSRIAKEMKPFTEKRQQQLEDKIKEIDKLRKIETKPSKGFVRIENPNGMIVEIPAESSNDFLADPNNKDWKKVKI